MNKHLWSSLWALSHFWPAMGISAWQVNNQCHLISHQWMVLEWDRSANCLCWLQKAFDVYFIVSWFRNSTTWKYPVIWWDGFPVTCTNEYNNQCYGGSHLQPELHQVYLKVLFWDPCCSWFVLMACLGFSYQVASLFSRPTTSCIVERLLPLKTLVEFRVTWMSHVAAYLSINWHRIQQNASPFLLLGLPNSSPHFVREWITSGMCT